MNRVLLLLVPVAAIATTAPAFGAGQAAANANPAKHWADSLAAETDQKYDVALAETTGYQREGGDAFLASERTGWLHYLNAKYPQAEQAYTAANKLQPAAINPLLGLLNAAQAQKDTKKIERAAEALLRVEPSNYRALMALAGAHFAAREYQKSASEYRRVLTYYPDDVDAMSGLGWSAFYNGGKRDASESFKKILSVSPEYPYAQRGYDLATGKATN
jgi:tetratricopeptide (TPR) repeat protein